MTNKDKFMLLVSDRPSGTVERNKERIKNREMLRASQDIALKILNKLDVLEWSKADLAREMNVSPQYISKIVQGKENLTLDTIRKLEIVLDIPILASYYENKGKNLVVHQNVVVDKKRIGSFKRSEVVEQPQKNKNGRKFAIITPSANKFAHYTAN